MKISLFALLVGLSASVVSSLADEPRLPPPEMKLKEEWATLESKNFNDWTVEKFVGWSGVADGGSIAFEFLTAKGVKFDILIANPEYWNAADKKAKRQVVYLLESGRFYLLVPASAQEKRLLQILVRAREDLAEDGRTSRQIMDALIKTIQSRNPVGAKWPLISKKK